VSHLLDVRRVISGARTATGVAAFLLALYAGYCIARRRVAPFSRGMRAGALAIGLTVILALAASFLDFGALFAAFHGLFFAAGTWTFPADSLLIRLFPERFWMASGAAWAALCVTGALVLAAVARFVRGAEARLSASRTAHNV
jgi:integral membrane protein (TIGR01906 family)